MNFLLAGTRGDDSIELCRYRPSRKSRTPPPTSHYARADPQVLAYSLRNWAGYLSNKGSLSRPLPLLSAADSLLLSKAEAIMSGALFPSSLREEDKTSLLVVCLSLVIFNLKNHKRIIIRRVIKTNLIYKSWRFCRHSLIYCGNEVTE